MRYRANKKVSRRRRRRHQRQRQQDPHQKQYVLFPFGWGHNDVSACDIKIVQFYMMKMLYPEHITQIFICMHLIVT